MRERKHTEGTGNSRARAAPSAHSVLVGVAISEMRFGIGTATISSSSSPSSSMPVTSDFDTENPRDGTGAYDLRTGRWMGKGGRGGPLRSSARWAAADHPAGLALAGFQVPLSGEDGMFLTVGLTVGGVEDVTVRLSVGGLEDGLTAPTAVPDDDLVGKGGGAFPPAARADDIGLDTLVGPMVVSWRLVLRGGTGGALPSAALTPPPPLLVEPLPLLVLKESPLAVAAAVGASCL